ncbi:MAG: hypothetical protein FWC33_02820 [Candidatus Bathyarchaeota archaeon]|nr:hypothetical protein [Candidatus Termiticorpusculum sp.]
MVDLSDKANFNSQKATSTKNSQVTIGFTAITAFLTVLMPLMLITWYFGYYNYLLVLSVLTASYCIASVVIWSYLNVKYTEYSGDYLMFFAADYFEKNFAYSQSKPQRSAIIRCAFLIAEKFKFDEAEVYAELKNYYNL